MRPVLTTLDVSMRARSKFDGSAYIIIMSSRVLCSFSLLDGRYTLIGNALLGMQMWARSHICFKLLDFHNASWFFERRSFLLNARNILLAGRTGSRATGGKPQPRREDGVSLARALHQ
jgi:hypothetical protein